MKERPCSLRVCLSHTQTILSPPIRFVPCDLSVPYRAEEGDMCVDTEIEENACLGVLSFPSSLTLPHDASQVIRVEPSSNIVFKVVCLFFFWAKDGDD